MSVFDNVEAEIAANTPAELVVVLKNPTPAPAQVSVVVESAAAAKVPWPENALFGIRNERLAPGETKVVRLDKRGTLSTGPGPASGPMMRAGTNGGSASPQ